MDNFSRYLVCIKTLNINAFEPNMIYFYILNRASGCVLYELVTLQKLFDEASSESQGVENMILNFTDEILLQQNLSVDSLVEKLIRRFFTIKF